MIYAEDEYLQLSGLQHFYFCRRQWALIHIEKQWAENFHTVDGSIKHEKAHNKDLRESRSDVLITRGVSIFSSTLGVSGQCDILEYHHDEFGIKIAGKDGLWLPFPVEYKRGSPRDDSADVIQLCAQAMCLEEMLCCDISVGALYYSEIRHRQNISFTNTLREEVKKSLNEMHSLYRRGHTPIVKPKKSCNACSLKEFCIPQLTKCGSVKAYLSKTMEDTL